MERIYNTLRENRKLPMTDEQLSDLGVDFHQFDIRTGTISSPSVTSYFLPRVDFRDVLDSDLAASPFLEAASCSEVPGPRRHPWILESFEMAMFPDMMTDQYNYFTWTGSDFSFKEFHQEGIPNGGWVVDRDTHFFLGGGLLSVRREFLDFECTNTEKLEFPLDELSCHEHKGHQRSIVGFCNQEKCGDKRPSSMELFAIAALTHEEMTEVDRERSYKNRSDESRSDESRSDEDRSDECYFTFPHLVFLMDKFGGCHPAVINDTRQAWANNLRKKVEAQGKDIRDTKTSLEETENDLEETQKALMKYERTFDAHKIELRSTVLDKWAGKPITSTRRSRRNAARNTRNLGYKLVSLGFSKVQIILTYGGLLSLALVEIAYSETL
ncbi:hypothetical protein PENNAL_c0027G01885 [Penicillium nalgiovense]|uniref:Uncharacterized protein n=1 Tax=Penicillium nalgiovense TaxID=60175 RepID=A0A1V6YA08_PENNA|nr:hypothetical protein PENNAL_c0027G01885 [Penicillium nalgiovense]